VLYGFRHLPAQATDQFACTLLACTLFACTLLACTAPA